MIEFKNVYKKYDSGTEALKNVNLRIERGEFVFIVGASGSGKSTFLKTIMREEVPTSGTIMINNYDLTKMTNKEIPYFRRTMGIVFQDFRLIPNMNVYDNVAFAMRVIGANEKDIRKRVPYVLSLVGLNEKARSLPTEISGGEQQRVALARALVNNANTIIADEPTGNIDPEMSYEIVDLLNHINENGTTIIMVTHEHELVKKFNHRIVVIDHGMVVSDTAAGGILKYRADTGYKPVEVSPTGPMSPDRPVPEQSDIGATVYSAPARTAAVPQATTAPYTAPVTSAPSPAQKYVNTSAPVVQQAPATQQRNATVRVVTLPVKTATVPVAGSPLNPAATPEATSTEAGLSGTQKTSFTTIDGIDYSKYFEDIDEVIRKDGSSK